MARGAAPVSATIGTQKFVCTVCKSEWFWYRKIHLTSGRELAGWAKASATGLHCTVCGYLHLFYNENLQLWKQPDQG
jgi:hypothetical protein